MRGWADQSCLVDNNVHSWICFLGNKQLKSSHVYFNVSLVVKCKWTKSRIPCAIKWEDGTSDHIVQYAGVQVAFLLSLSSTHSRGLGYSETGTPCTVSKVASNPFLHAWQTATGGSPVPAVLSTVNFVPLRRGPLAGQASGAELGLFKAAYV